MPMASADTPAVQNASKIHLTAFVAVNWVMFSLATAFVALRTIVRLKTLHKLAADDALVLFAWTMTLTSVVLCQWINEDMYLDHAMAALALAPTPEIMTRAAQWLKVDAALLILFYSCLWAIKLSFLLFFRRLYFQVRWLQVYWWVVLVITVATWAVCVGTIPYDCLLPPFEVIMQHCATKAKSDYNRHTLYVSTVMDLFSDLLVMSIPLSVLWGVQIGRKRKAALGAIFSLSVITMIIAVIRAALVTTATVADLDTPWAVLWSIIEQCIAIMVACLAFFRSLFTNSHVPSTPRQYRQYSSDERKKGGVQNVTALISEIANLESLTSEEGTLKTWYDDGMGLTQLESKDTSRDRV